jgi:hypothetical protein
MAAELSFFSLCDLPIKVSNLKVNKSGINKLAENN